jgi:hypothetical protein
MNRVLNISGDIVMAGNQSGIGNNDSFLIARSLSPKEKTGKFGIKFGNSTPIQNEQ